MVFDDVRSSSPPTRASLKAWWKQFNIRQKGKKPNPDDKDEHAPMVFGVPLKESLRYASVQISTANADGQMYVWGYIPVVVAKCGLYLKERATEVEGTFRVSGSNKRMKELQALFETPPRYGKSLDWKKETYTTHDVASVFRRYLTMMPEPVVPTNLYHEFRNVYREKHKAEEVVKEYKQIIRSMPRANQYLLLYVLDLLSVFARKSSKNLMTASNLAVIFRPGILAHPDHDLVPSEAELSQRVLEFLIEHQDWFMLDIPPPPRSNSTMSATQSVQPSSELTPPPMTQEPERMRNEPVEEEDLVIIPSSDDEHGSNKPSSSNSPHTSGGWKLITRRNRIGRDRDRGTEGRAKEVARSKSNVDRRQPRRVGTGELSPVNEVIPIASNGDGDDIVLGGTGGANVGRSRTMPSKRSVSGSHSGDEKEKERTTPNVLKKSKKPRPLSMGVAGGALKEGLSGVAEA